MHTRSTLRLATAPARRTQPFAGIRLGRQIPAAQNPIGFLRPVAAAPGGLPVHDTSDGGLLTIAGTGAGKGVSQVIPTLLTYPGSIIVNDTKGELAAVTARRRREMGQKVFHLDPFGPGATAALNPFSVIRPFGTEAPEQCAALAAQLVPGTGTHDPFWESAARRLIMGTCLFIATYLSPAYRTLGTVARIWNSGETRLSEYLAAMKRCSHYGGLIRDAASFYEDAPDKTRTSLLTSVREPLGFLASVRGQSSLSGNEIPPALLREGTPMTVYLRVPPYLMTSQSKLLRIWLGTLISVLASRTVRPTVPDLLLIDEAAQVGKLDELLTAVSLLRGYGLRCWTFWQSLGQLEGLWGARHREFLDNASVLSVFGLANGASAAAAAALTGLDYEMLLDMTREQQALARFGERPMLCDRIDYRHDPDLMLLADTNPFHRPGFAAQEDIRHG